MMILDDSSDSKIIFREILYSLNTEVGRVKEHSSIMDMPIRFRETQTIVIKNDDYGSSGFWSDKFCRLCLEFEAMSHREKERTEIY